MSREIPDEELLFLIRSEVNDLCRRQLLTLKQREEIERRLYHSFRKLDVLQELIDDPEVTEIMVNGPDHIFYEKNGSLTRYPYRFDSAARLDTIIQIIAGRANKRINESQPIVDTRLPDGSRVNAVVAPVAVSGSSLSIRKFPANPMTMERLVKLGSLDETMTVFFSLIVAAGYNIFVSGGTGSGKTTFLNALSAFIPEGERVVTIEDSAELQMKQVENLVRLETKSESIGGAPGIGIRDLLRTALRMRPDRIIVGEVRGAECLDMLQANNTGHNGSMSTGHANSAQDMLSRLETMVLMGMDLPLFAVRGQIAYGLDILVHLGRLRDRSRKVLSVDEITGIKDGQIMLHPLYRFEEQMSDDKKENRRAKVSGTWVQKGTLIDTRKLIDTGLFEECRRYGFCVGEEKNGTGERRESC